MRGYPPGVCITCIMYNEPLSRYHEGGSVMYVVHVVHIPEDGRPGSITGHSAAEGRLSPVRTDAQSECVRTRSRLRTDAHPSPLLSSQSVSFEREGWIRSAHRQGSAENRGPFPEPILYSSDRPYRPCQPTGARTISRGPIRGPVPGPVGLLTGLRTGPGRPRERGCGPVRPIGPVPETYGVPG